MLISALLAVCLPAPVIPHRPLAQTGKWGLVRKVEGHAPPPIETYYGSTLSATVSEGSFQWNDTPTKPGVLTSADVSATWSRPDPELEPNKEYEFTITSKAKVSEKDYNLLNWSCWFSFTGFEVLEQQQAWVGHGPNGFVARGSGKYKIRVPKGQDGVELHIWQGQTGLAYGSGGNFYPCQYWYKWNAPPIDTTKPPKEPEKKPEEERKPEDPTKEKVTILYNAFDYREVAKKIPGNETPADAMLVDAGRVLYGVAADGTSLVLLKASTKVAGRATFRIPSIGGGLLAVSDSNLYHSKGSSTLTVNTVEVNGLHHAFALYRPPTSFGSGREEIDLEFPVGIEFNEDKYADGNGTTSIKLVRPPIVLVHGTYDNPAFCYQQHDDRDDAPMNLEPRLRNAGFKDIFCVDWEDTNGSKDPSSFITNSKAVWMNKNGIQDALAAMRVRNIAVTQADLVCHSQGGVIARVFARGYYLKDPIPDAHLTDPVECRSGATACWYHRKDNHWSGDIHRLITISTTHRGSEVCRLFEAFAQYGPNWNPLRDVNRLLLNIFLTYVDTQVSGITTEGFKNQTPGARELEEVGPTPVPAHAIGCVATDEDMANTRPDSGGITDGLGDYYGRLYKIWKLTPDDAKQFAFNYLGDKAAAKGDPKPKKNAEEYERLNRKVLEDRQTKAFGANIDFRKIMDPVIFHMRKTVFLDQENDCTVSFPSSCGGLNSAYTTKAEHVLHGWAPRYRVVQDRVLELLRNDGSLFDPNGFPDYNGKQSSASGFLGRASNPPTTALFNRGGGDPALTRPTEAAAVAGTYTTAEGDWIFEVSGSTVKGKHVNDLETLEGTLNGHTLKFILTDRQDKTEGEIVFSEDWKSFDGYYRDPEGLKWEMKGTKKSLLWCHPSHFRLNHGGPGFLVAIQSVFERAA